MADNQTIHNGAAGDGTAFDSVADEITSPYTGGTAKAQGVKLLGGAANSSEVIEGTAANGLEVDVTRLPKGTKSFSDPAPTSTASSIVSANATRKSVTIQNAGTVTVYLGGTSGVTTTNGILLAPNCTLCDESSTDAWWAVTASGTGDLRIVEVA